MIQTPTPENSGMKREMDCFFFYVDQLKQMLPAAETFEQWVDKHTLWNQDMLRIVGIGHWRTYDTSNKEYEYHLWLNEVEYSPTRLDEFKVE